MRGTDGANPSGSGAAAASPAPLSVACGDISPRWGESAPVGGAKTVFRISCLPPLIGEAAKPKVLTEGVSYAEKDNPSVSLLADSSLYTREPL